MKRREDFFNHLNETTGLDLADKPVREAEQEATAYFMAENEVRQEQMKALATMYAPASTNPQSLNSLPRLSLVKLLLALIRLLIPQPKNDATVEQNDATVEQEEALTTNIAEAFQQALVEASAEKAAPAPTPAAGAPR